MCLQSIKNVSGPLPGWAEQERVTALALTGCISSMPYCISGRGDLYKLSGTGRMLPQQ